MTPAVALCASVCCSISLVFAAAAENPVRFELVDGQYRVTVGTYSSVVPRTGLIRSLSLGASVFMSRPLVVNTGDSWNVPNEHS